MLPQLARAPATRWDRLVAVLEDVDPERVIDAFHIIERAKRHSISDLELFYILGIYYQRQYSRILRCVLNLYILTSTWIEWLRSVDSCLRARRLGSTCTTSSADQSASHTQLATAGHRTSRYVTENVDSSVSSAGPPGGQQGYISAASHSSRCTQPPNASSNSFRSPRFSAGKKAGDNKQPVFDLGPHWVWEGTLDFLRDGTQLSFLVQEALSYCLTKRETPGVSVRDASYVDTFPSLSDIDRFSNSYTESCVLSSENVCFSCLKPRRHRPSRNFALRVIQEREKTEAEQAVETLNQLCEEHLGWKPDEYDGRHFLDDRSGDGLLRPVNEADEYLLGRLHWLGVALFHTVRDPSIIPAPPRVSFIMMNQKPQILVDNTDEDSDLALLIATKSSCLPHNHKVNITAHCNILEISHPVAHPTPLCFECCVVAGVAFVYIPKLGAFVVMWSVLQYFLKSWDGIHWVFEMSSMLEEKAHHLLLTTSTAATRQESEVRGNRVVTVSTTARRLPPLLSSTILPARAASPADAVPNSSTNFDLTIKSSLHRVSAMSGSRRSSPLPEQDPTRSMEGGQSRWQRGNGNNTVTPLPVPETTPAPSAVSSRAGWACMSADGVSPADNGDLVVSCTLSAVTNPVKHPQAVPPQGFFPSVQSAVEMFESFHEEQMTPPRSRAAGDFSSECCKVVNFSATVVHESTEEIAIRQHQFRVSGRPIGKGAFGAVYRALDLESGVIVAVKQSRLSYGDEMSTDLNWREFQTWSMLPSHPNVITFHGASKEVETHQLLLVMEYASGGSILALYHNFHPVPENIFYRHARGIALGLKHLHDHNVIHGDVKPENVLTRSDGSVAISDFGCSRLPLGAELPSMCGESSTVRGRGAAKDNSGTWRVSGTAAYMAPEVITNKPDFKSDAWAYACSLIHLWLGATPWSECPRTSEIHDTIPLIFCIVQEDVVPYTSEQLAETPRWVQRIAQRAFEREVDRRCNMAEVLKILTEYYVA